MFSACTSPVTIVCTQFTPKPQVERARWLASSAVPASPVRVLVQGTMGLDQRAFPRIVCGSVDVALRELDASKKPMQEFLRRLNEASPAPTKAASSHKTDKQVSSASHAQPEREDKQNWFWEQGYELWQPFDLESCTLLRSFMYDSDRDAITHIKLFQGSSQSGKYIANLLSMTQHNIHTHNIRKIRYTGPFILRPYSFPRRPACNYGIEHSVAPHPASVPPSDECLLLQMPNDVLIEIFCNLLTYCKCKCHKGEIYGDLTVGSLCTLPLVCGRFHTSIADLQGRTLPEEAAKCICQKLNVKCNNTTRLEAILASDPKVQRRDNDLKAELHNIAFGMTAPGSHVENHPGRRKFAVEEITRRWGSIDNALKTQSEAPGIPAPACFFGNGKVLMANGDTKLVQDIQVGDLVMTEKMIAKAVARIQFDVVLAERAIVFINGLGCTPGHPVILPGEQEWQHPFEVAEVQKVYTDYLYNFELAGGPEVADHSVIINGMAVATLGKDCGKRITEGWPKADLLYGRGYWSSNASAWAQASKHHYSL